VEREWRNVTPFSLSGVLLCRLSLKINEDFFGKTIRRLPEDGRINTVTHQSLPVSRKPQRRGSKMPDEEVPGEDVPEPPEHWHEENKSDVPEDELEGVDD